MQGLVPHFTLITTPSAEASEEQGQDLNRDQTQRLPTVRREPRCTRRDSLPLLGASMSRRAEAWSILLGYGGQVARSNESGRGPQPLYTISGNMRPRTVESASVTPVRVAPLVPRSPLTSQEDTDIFSTYSNMNQSGLSVPPPYSLDLPPAYDSLFPQEEKDQLPQVSPV